MSSPDSARRVACDAGARSVSVRRECGMRLPGARWTCGPVSPPGQRFCGEMRFTVEGERKLDVAMMQQAMVEIITRFHEQNRVALHVGHPLPAVPATV